MNLNSKPDMRCFFVVVVVAVVVVEMDAKLNVALFAVSLADL